MKKLGFALAFALAVAAAQPAVAGEAFLKGGYIVKPSGIDVSDAWFVSVGSDYNLTPVAFLGFDIQGAYRSASIPGVLKLSQVPTNFFVNGKWKMEAEAIRPYGGAGLGLVAAYTRATTPAIGAIPGTTVNDYTSDAGFQFMGGVEFNQKWVVEFLGQKQFQNGVPWQFSIGGGIRW